MSAFHDLRLPLLFSFGAQMSLERRTEISELNSGREIRNALWANARRQYDIGPAIQSLDHVSELVAFFEARMGRLFGFRFRDFTDFKSSPPSRDIASSDQLLGIGDGINARFDLVKHYESGGETRTRRITCIDIASLRVEKAGQAQSAGQHYDVDGETGSILFRAGSVPLPGQSVRAGFHFDVPVRFAADRLDIVFEAPRAGRALAVNLIEIFK